jgi:hypothetical protein
MAATAAAMLMVLRKRAHWHRQGAAQQNGRQPSGNFCHDESSSTFAPPPAEHLFKLRKAFFVHQNRHRSWACDRT